MDRYLPELQTSQSQIETGEWLRLWSLDPNITFLNHGSFGACPIAVLKHQQSLQAQMEAAPVRFFAMELEALIDEARQALAHFVGADAAGLVFVPNRPLQKLRSLPYKGFRNRTTSSFKLIDSILN